MKQIALFTCLKLIILNLFSQAEPVKVITESDMRNLTSGTSAVITNMDALYEGVKGTPYYNREWTTGDILFTDDKQINHVKIKYNVYKDELEYLNKTSGHSFIVQRERIKGFLIMDSAGIKYFENIQVKPGKTEFTFAEVAYSGSVKLFIKYKKTFTAADYKGAYSSGIKYDEYKDDKDYYVTLSNCEITRIKLNKKQVLELLSAKKAEIEQYINDKNPDLSNHEDVVKIMTYYDSLN